MTEDVRDHSIALMRMKELSDLVSISMPNLNKYFKNHEEDVVKTGSKITGIKPSGVEKILRKHGFDDIYGATVSLINSQCGGIGKTTSTISLAMSFARLSDRDKNPIVILDIDGQASTTLQLIGKQKQRLPVLDDFIKKRVPDIDSLMIPIGDNVFLIPSSQANHYLELSATNSGELVEIGVNTINALFESVAVDGKLKIFIDCPPALSPLTHSFIYALNKLPANIDKVLALPMRPDDFAVEGCEIAIKQFKKTLKTFNIPEIFKVVPFLSFFDRRTSNSEEGMQLALENEIISEYKICPIVIRESAEIPKKLRKKSHIFSRDGYSPTSVGGDYQDLMLYIFEWRRK